MESFLNLLWVAIALGALGVWRLCWVRQHGDAIRRPLLEWTAFGCALVLLFFAVSLTDDLHFELLLLDECSTGRHANLCACPHHTQDNANGAGRPDAAILAQAASNVALREIALVVPVVPSGSVVFESDLASGRAPPVSSL
jgi:hypothetical protein